jgi:PAS domain-containing protein/DNA-binding CsgD family transcriptional regulator
VTPEELSSSPLAEMLAGASVVHQQAIERLSVPAIILELPGRRIRAVNQAFADLLATTPAEMVGRPNDEVIPFDDVEGMKLATAALESGAIDGYRARRHITAHDGVRKEVIAWCRLVEVDAARYAAYIITPVEPGETWMAEPPVAWAGPLVVGTIDAAWRLERVSSDINDLFGLEPVEAVGSLLLDVVRPDDVAGLLAAAQATWGGSVTCMRQVHVRHRDGSWVPVQLLLVHLTDGPSSPMAFAVLPEPELTAGPPTERVAEMERRLRRIASELRAAGMMDDIDTLPSAEEFPQLATLSSRQWQILVRLLRGERVPAIAAELHVAQGTLRNHLSAMFERFDVHSQAELIGLLRRR